MIGAVRAYVGGNLFPVKGQRVPNSKYLDGRCRPSGRERDYQ